MLEWCAEHARDHCTMFVLLSMNDVTGEAEVVLMSATLCEDLYRLDPLSEQGVSL